jgi:hypothetical protein
MSVYPPSSELLSAPPASGGERSTSRAILLLLAAGALVRLALWGQFQDVGLPIWDENDYNILAKSLVEHGEFGFEPGLPTSLRPPLYPAMVAGVYSLFGVENFQAVRLLQATLSLLNVWLLYRLGLEIASRRVALWLAGIFCFYPSLLGFNNLLLTETLFTLLLCAVCYTVALFYRRGALGYLVGAGVLLGLAALTRSVVWMAPPFVAVFLLLTWKDSWRRRALAPIAFLAAFCCTLAPWAVRNTILQETFVAVDTMGGRNFMMGNYQHTPLYRSWDTISMTGELSWDHQLATAYPPQERNTQGKIDKLALREGLKFVRDNPWLTFQRDLIKFFDFWGLERELIAGASQGYFGEIARAVVVALTVLIFGMYAAVMALGIFGMVMTPLSDRRVHWFLVLVIAYVCGLHTLVFAHSRYHLPIMPLMIVFAACALVNLRRVWSARQSWGFQVAGGLTGLLVLGWSWGLVTGDWERFLQIVRSVV